MTIEKILIVDDEPFNVDYLEQELEEAGYVTMSAMNGRQALELIASDPPALVLLDIMMPIMDGFEVLSRLKEQPHTRDIPVIVISADANLQSVVKGICMGAEDYLPKPFEPVLLQARIASCLEKKRMRDLEKIYLQGLEREIEIASQVQQSFLPKDIPELPGWEISFYFQAAREVAGDYYDAFLLPSGQLVCLIGDVCDKGVGAALFMALFRSLIRAIATSGMVSWEQSAITTTPSEFLEQLVSFTNQYVCDTHGDSGLFTSLFICLLNPDDGRLTYINAGNEPPFWLQSAGQVTELRPTGPVVGIIPEAQFSARQIQLQAGDLLFAFTDGASDAKDAHNEILGKPRLLEMVQTSSRSPEEMLRAIVDQSRVFTGEVEQFDDITMLAVRKR